nr:AMP-binding protein [Pannonibacter sp. XCT-34]
MASHAAARPDAPAVFCGSRSLTWSELVSRIEARAGHLARALSVSGAFDRAAVMAEPDDGEGGMLRAQPRVALDLPDPLELLLSFFAVARVGAVALVLDPGWPQHRKAAILAATDPALVWTPADLADPDSADGSGDVACLPPVPLVVPAPLPAPLPAPVPAPRPEQLFYAGFTSGSTGVPKGYARTHRSWTESFRLSRAAFAIGPQDHVLVPGGLSHSLHLYGAVEALEAGASVTLAQGLSPGRLARLLAEAAVTVLYGTPTQLVLLTRDSLRLGVQAPALRLALVSGATWGEGEKAALRLAFPGLRLAEFYGASEMSFITLNADPDPAPAGSVGRAFPGVEIEIRDAAGRRLAAGETGTIHVRSPLLFAGYICGGGEEVRRNAGFLTVGDRGHLDAAGNLFLAGREQRMFVSAGLNLFPEEAEALLRALPEIALAAVFGAPDRLRGRVPVAALLPAAGLAPAADRDAQHALLRRRCLGVLMPSLGRARCPRRFHLFDAFPLTPGGKIDLPALERHVLEREAERAGKRLSPEDLP